MDYARVRELRIMHGEKQEDIAKLLGYKTSSGYSKKENGVIPFTIEDAKKLSKHYNISLDALCR